MRLHPAILAAACALALTPAAEARVRHRHAAEPARPVLVELFTAQGCEGCPQADLSLADLARRKGVVALTFSVDIWDYTGWTDTFAMPEFTERQQAYVKRLKLREVYTPEVVVNGEAESSGLDKEAIAALVAKAGRGKASGPTVRLSADSERVSVSAGRTPVRTADVWLIRYDPKAHDVKVKSGDNKGKTLTVANVVKELVKLGQWRGRAKRFDIPDPPAEGLKAVVVVQEARGGPILALGRD